MERYTKTRLLYALGLIQTASFLYYWYYYDLTGYLPAPFSYDKTDTFMDYFHVAYWTETSGRYTDWGSVYPPINFLFIKIVNWLLVGPTQFSDGFGIRATSLASEIFIVVLYAAVPAITMTLRLWSGFSVGQRVLIYVSIVLSPPLLFAMERGNLIILCLPLAAMALGSRGWPRALAIALAINVKPYFALLLLAPLIAGALSEFMLIGFLAGAIFLGTGLILDPDFMSFLGNLLSFSGSEDVFSGRAVLALPSTIAAFAYASAVFFREGVGANLFGLTLADASVIISNLNALLLLAALITLAVAGRRLDQPMILAFLMVMIANLGIFVGGYFFLMYPALIPVFMTRRRGWIHIGLVVAIMLPLDVVVLYSDIIAPQRAFLSGILTPVEWQFGLGSVLRPALDVALLASLTLDLIADFDTKGLRQRFAPQKAVSA